MLDTARDAQAIVGVFHDNKAVFDGKHPFTPEHLRRLGENGDWLVAALKPRTPREPLAERDPASILRDQFGALLAERYDALREAGVVVFGLKNLDERIPPLASRAGGAHAPRRPPRSAARPRPMPAPRRPRAPPPTSDAMR